MLFREYIDMVLNESESLEDAIKDVNSIEDVESNESGAVVVPTEDVPADAVNVDSEKSEEPSEQVKFLMKGASTIDEAWEKYSPYYTKVMEGMKSGGIQGGKIYTLGITSLAKGMTGNARVAHIVDGKPADEPKTKKERTEARNNAFLLISQCRVKEIGIMEGFYKKFVLGARISLVSDSKQKKIGDWLMKSGSRIEKDKKKFKHIKSQTHDFSDTLPENEYVVPIHWIPRLREIIETEISRKHKDDMKAEMEAIKTGTSHTSPKSLHVKSGYEGRVKAGERNTFKLPPKGTKEKLGRFGRGGEDEE